MVGCRSGSGPEGRESILCNYNEFLIGLSVQINGQHRWICLHQRRPPPSIMKVVARYPDGWSLNAWVAADAPSGLVS